MFREVNKYGAKVKYTRYILHDSMDFDSVGVVALPATVFAVPLIMGLFGGALLMDGGRIIKLRYLLFKRKQKRLNYIKCVLRSLDREATRDNIQMLKAA